ncbi:MAG: hemerythrin domain-containing protein [Archangiaceae bacterium]|nr:hemerythrin domain-containing protein [Archangiaceae bacterium]
MSAPAAAYQGVLQVPAASEARPPASLAHLDAHQRLDHALAEVEFLAERRSFGPAAKRFVELSRELRAHIQEEEAVTFVELERKGTLPPPQLEAIRSQHRRLEQHLETLNAALVRSDYAAFEEQLPSLDRELKEHQTTEEQLFGGAPAR